jgi:hypothetical protein
VIPIMVPPAASAARLAAEANFMLAPIAFAFARAFVFTAEAERLIGKTVNPELWLYPHAWRPVEVIFGAKKLNRTRSGVPIFIKRVTIAHPVSVPMPIFFVSSTASSQNDREFDFKLRRWV